VAAAHWRRPPAFDLIGVLLDGEVNGGHSRPVRGRAVSRRRSGNACSPTQTPRRVRWSTTRTASSASSDRATWAGSPAASFRTAARPSTRSSWPSSWAASMPPPPSWAPPGRRCAKPSPATASACPLATPKRSASAPSTPPTNTPTGPAAPPLDPVFVALNPGAPPARGRPPAELYQWVRREEQYATPGRQRGGRAVQRKPRPQAHQPRMGDHPPGQPRAPAGRPTCQPRPAPPQRSRRPHEPVPPIAEAGDGGRCLLTSTGRTASTGSATLSSFCCVALGGQLAWVSRRVRVSPLWV
jgi:hypothetical protein